MSLYKLINISGCLLLTKDETIQDLEYQNVTNKLILGILDENRLKEAKKNAKNKDVFK